MISAEDRQRLATSRLFANVSLDSVEHLFPRCHMLRFLAGEHILEPGAANNLLYVILEGDVRVHLAGSAMPEHAVFSTGDCVGEISLLDGQQVSALVLAATDTRTLVMPHDVLWALVDCSHGVARNLLAILAGRMRNDNRALVRSQAIGAELEQAATLDALTGVHNRRWMMQAFPRAIDRCERDGSPACLLIADVDLFKNFNDRFGHLVGDAVLRYVAREIAGGLRTQDLVARYGGEEFVALFPGTTLADSLAIVERLRRLIANGGGVSTEQGAQVVTLSCGIAQRRAGENLEDLIARADAALMIAKDNGRDRVEVARP